ncbi:MAG TPA: YkgJ family cysteine cluster protein [Thermoanaerobaculia bacterium]|nr:YkgJ family cysteine cluster protein [Thermoanaerobaculia bacterium]
MPSSYDCTKCPAYCCSYDEIEVKAFDVRRLASHLGIDREAFLERFTKSARGPLPVLRHQRDRIYKSVCVFLDTKTRRCTVYDARPEVCRTYPDRPRCGYWDFLSWEREFQDDESSLPMSSKSWKPKS